jgi:hypothetical protein
MKNDLLSDYYFNKTVEYVEKHSPRIIERNEKKAYGNCPFCQSAPDSHRLCFGVWCHHGKVFLGCQRCEFGTRNNVIEFIQRIENVDFQDALNLWREFCGIPTLSHEKYVESLGELYEHCKSAFSGNGKYKQNKIIKYSRNTLMRDFGWEFDDLFTAIYNEMVVLYFTRPQINRRYLVQSIANSLQKLVREEIENPVISETRLAQNLGGDSGKGNVGDTLAPNEVIEFAARKSYSDHWQTDESIKEMHTEALRRAYRELNDIQLKIVIGDITYREASMITGKPISTIEYQLKSKLKRIREECLPD